MNGAGSPGQQRWIGSRSRSTSSPSSTTSWHGPATHRLRQRVGDRLQLRQAPAPSRRAPAAAASRARPASRVADVVEARRVEGEAHAPLGAELVDQQRVARALRVLEEERRAAGLDRAVDDLGDLEVRVDLGRRRGRARPRARGARSSRAGRPEGPARSVYGVERLIDRLVEREPSPLLPRALEVSPRHAQRRARRTCHARSPTGRPVRAPRPPPALPRVGRASASTCPPRATHASRASGVEDPLAVADRPGDRKSLTRRRTKRRRAFRARARTPRSGAARSTRPSGSPPLRQSLALSRNRSSASSPLPSAKAMSARRSSAKARLRALRSRLRLSSQSASAFL